MSGDTQRRWRRFRPGPFELVMGVFVVMVLVLMQILLVQEVLASQLTAAEMEVFALTYEIVGVALAALLVSAMAMALDQEIPAVAATFGDRVAHALRAAVWGSGAIVIAVSWVQSTGRFEANPEFNTALSLFVLAIVGLFIGRAIPEPTYQRVFGRIRRVVIEQ